MFDIKTDPDGRLVSVQPDGRISESDVEALAAALNETINTHDRIPGLLIHAKSFPGYENLAAMLAHLELVHRRENVLPRVALVSDGVFMRLGEALAKVFVEASVRHFATGDLADAQEWARTGSNTPRAVTVLDGFPNDVLALEISGRLRAVDYDAVIEPLIDAKMQRHDRIKILIVVNEDFEGATMAAAWEDLKLDMKGFTRYRKMAIVTDLLWLRNSTRLFSPFMPGQVQTYSLAKRALAEEWIRT